MSLQTEFERRDEIWSQLLALGSAKSIAPAALRTLGVYGGASGVWVNKSLTGPLSPDGNGIAVAVLHTGTSYNDDLSEECLIYHFPDTARPGGRDDAEIASLHNALLLAVPLFVVTHSETNSDLRDVQLGRVVDFDREGAQCLIALSSEFNAPVINFSSIADDFRLKASRTEILKLSKRLKRAPRFAYEVGRRCGWRCAVCSLEVRALLDAAHVRGVADKGSDHPLNGLILCKNHHAAFDCNLINFNPENGQVVMKEDVLPEQIGVTVMTLPSAVKPHADALAWRWARFTRFADAKPG